VSFSALEKKQRKLDRGRKGKGRTKIDFPVEDGVYNSGMGKKHTKGEY